MQITRKYIITENQELKLILLRRLTAIDGLIDYYCNRVSGYIDFCDYPFEVFLEAVGSDIIDAMYYDYFSDLDDDGEDWGFLYKMMRKYIRKNQEKIRNYYDNKCNKRAMKDNITESKNGILLFFKRRLNEFDELFERTIIKIGEENSERICDMDFEGYVEFVIDYLDMEFDWLFGNEIDDDNMEKISDLIDQYVREKKLDKIFQYYNQLCPEKNYI